MKKIIISLALIVLALTGCVKDASPAPEHSETGQVTFTISPDTKSSTEAGPNDGIIDALRIYIFDNITGTLEAVVGGTFDSTTPSYSTRLAFGQKRVITIANQDSYLTESDVTGLSDFLSTCRITWDYFIETKHLPMISDQVISFTPTNQSFRIALGCAASRFHIRSINNKLQVGGKNTSIRVWSVVMTNIPGYRTVDFNRPFQCDLWYNKYGRSSVDPFDPIYLPNHADYESSVIPIRKALVYNNSLTFPISSSLYTFHNGTLTDANGMTNMGFSPRFTRLVLVIQTNTDKHYYYPINIRNMKPGYTYDVNITITRLGSDDPDTFNFMSSSGGDIEIGGSGDGGDVDIEF